MKTCIFLCLLGIVLHDAAAVTRSLKYFYTRCSGVPNFPEFVSVGLVDEVQVFQYDRDSKRFVPKQDWLKNITVVDPKYWEREIEREMGTQQVFKASIEIAKQHFSQTGGIHINQLMYGCEWDDETGDVNGYMQWGYDGEDFIVFDMKTETWIAPRQQAVFTKHELDKNKAWIVDSKNFLIQLCPDWLKKNVNYGKESLERKERPSVSLLQKTPSSPVSCHATGFHPNRAALFWRKDGEELHEHVDHGETLPNHDGTFQMSVDLDLSSVPAADWGRYDCVFQLSGVKEDITTRLETDKIWTNAKKPSDPTVIIIAAVVVLVLVLVIAVVGFFVHKKMKAKRPPSPVSNPEVLEELNPQPE